MLNPKTAYYRIVDRHCTGNVYCLNKDGEHDELCESKCPYYTALASLAKEFENEVENEQ